MTVKQTTAALATTFHGIVPGKSAQPVGRVSLEVAFGSTKNFCSEILSFEVVKFKSPYHAIHGRPAYARFMARACYIYLKLKMSGPHGVITVEGSRDIVLACEKDDVTYAEAAHVEESNKAQATVNPPSTKGIPSDPTLTFRESGHPNSKGGIISPTRKRKLRAPLYDGMHKFLRS